MINLNFIAVDSDKLQSFSAHLESIGKTNLLQQWRDLFTRVEGHYSDSGLMLDNIRSMADVDLRRHMEAYFASNFKI